MVRAFKTIFGFIFVFIVIVLIVINYGVTKYGKAQLENHFSKAFEADVMIGSFRLHYYPVSVSVSDIHIKKNNDTEPLKSINIKDIKVRFERSTLFSDLIIIKYVIVEEPKILFDASELAVSEVSQIVIKKVAADVVGQTLLGPVGVGLGIAKKGVDNVKGVDEAIQFERELQFQEVAYLDKVKEQKQFLIQNLYINKAKFYPANEVLWIGKKEGLLLPDIKVENVDNASALKVAKEIESVVGKSISERLDVLKHEPNHEHGLTQDHNHNDDIHKHESN
jgi:hypothetical protein